MSDFTLLPEKQKKTRRAGKKEAFPGAEKKGPGEGHPWGQTLTPRHAFGITPGADHYTPAERPLPAVPVQEEEKEKGHITIEKEMPPVTGVPLPASDRPTIIFESMGSDLETCKAVYDESCRYPGNTICVFGLNMRRDAPPGAGAAPTDFDKNAGYLKKYAGELAQGMDHAFLTAAENERMNQGRIKLAGWAAGRRGVQPAPAPAGPVPVPAGPVPVPAGPVPAPAQPVHLLYTFSFTWKKPAGVDEGDAYLMPFIEARQKVMQQAASVRENYQGEGVQYHFLYRWIDGDARNDTTAGIDADRLNQWAGDETPQVITGRYDWRHQEDGTAAAKPEYHRFVGKFNEAEQRLRDYYHNLARREDSDPLRKKAVQMILKLQQSRGYGDAERARIEDIKKNYLLGLMPLERRLDTNGYLPGYYFPETALTMNEAAHKTMKKDQGVGTGMQDKESMKIVKGIVGTLPETVYCSELTVEKPLKHEFEKGTYLGADLLAFFMGSNNGEEAFTVALNNVRQSAFNPRMWYFFSNSDIPGSNDEKNNPVRQKLLDKKRNEERKALWAYLQGAAGEGRRTILQAIRNELNPQERRQAAQGPRGQGRR